jgi:hypothetical protein
MTVEEKLQPCGLMFGPTHKKRPLKTLLFASCEIGMGQTNHAEIGSHPHLSVSSLPVDLGVWPKLTVHVQRQRLSTFCWSFSGFGFP